MSATAQVEGTSRRPRLRATGSNRSGLNSLARWLNGILLAFALFLIAGIAGLGFYAASHANQVYQGVTVAGISLGGLTEADARARIEAEYARFAATPLTLTAGDETYTLSQDALGARLDTEQTAAAAFAVGRTGSLWDRSRDWARGLVSGMMVAPRIHVDTDILMDQLEPIAAAVSRTPTDASINMSDAAEPVLLADIPGVVFDYPANQAAIMSHLSSFSSGPIALVSHVQPAAVASESLIPSLDEARTAVSAPLTITAPEGSWHIPTTDLKHVVTVDPGTGALNVDRRSLQTLVEGLAPSINREAVDAGLTVDANGMLAVVPSVEAATVDVASSVAALEAAVVAGGREAALVINRAAPAITDDLAAAGAERGEQLINAGMHLTWTGGELKLGRAELLRALTIHSRPGEAEPFGFGLDPTILAELVAPAAEAFDQEAADARFRLIGDEIRLVSEAKEGRALELDAAIEDMVAAFGDDQPRVEVTVRTLKPTVTAADRAGITLGDDVLAEASTFYGGSSEPRRQNVERGVELETGWLVPPDGVFSFADSIGGAIDEENGFVTGFGIIANEDGGVTTAPVIGGGICQVSTTLFQAIYWAGLPIEERTQHPYYLRSYGEAPKGLPGLDAMVNIEPDWAIDLKFRNTTGKWLVVILTADGETVEAKIVGTDPGWEVEVDQPVISNLVRAESQMNYTDSPELERGQTLLVESAEDGFDVAITRRVLDDGKVILEDTTRSSFSPSRNLTLRGTGAAD
jgi:vancomycin resistance protein YoaR